MTLESRAMEALPLAEHNVQGLGEACEGPDPTGFTTGRFRMTRLKVLHRRPRRQQHTVGDSYKTRCRKTDARPLGPRRNEKSDRQRLRTRVTSQRGDLRGPGQAEKVRIREEKQNHMPEGTLRSPGKQSRNLEIRERQKTDGETRKAGLSCSCGPSG